jgi:hypothetical protein
MMFQTYINLFISVQIRKVYILTFPYRNIHNWKVIKHEK